MTNEPSSPALDRSGVVGHDGVVYPDTPLGRAYAGAPALDRDTVEARELADEIEKSTGLIKMVPGEGTVQLGIKRTALVIRALRALIGQPARTRNDEAVSFINSRLGDLETANALYGKDQRLDVPNKIDRNNREISWLKDLRSIVRAAPSTNAQEPARTGEGK